MALLSRIAVAAVTLLAVYYIVGSVLSYRRLRLFKGPPLASFSRFWLFWKECRGTLPHAQVAALEKYGSPARIGHDLLVTDDAELIRHINAPGSRWTRSGWYDAMRMDPRQDNVFSTRNEEAHVDLKAKEAGGYNGRDINTLEPDIDSQVGEFIGLIRKHEGKVVDFAPKVRYFVLDVLSTVAFGRPFGFMAADEDKWDYCQTSDDFTLILGLTANHSSVRWLLSQDWVQALAAPKTTDKHGIGPALAFAHKAVSERYGPDAKPRKDMLGHFVNKGLSQVQCECEAFLQIMAGTDSSATILRCAIFSLAGNPRVYAKLRAEIDGVLGQNASVRYPDVLKLEYLKVVIWETIRLFPPLFGLKEKCAPVGGDEFNGVFYPEGSTVAGCDAAIMRRKDVFGDDASFFRPERLLEGDDALRRKRMQTVEVAFGSGKYLCLGKHIAMIELHKTIVAIMRNFDFAMADPMRAVDDVLHNVHQQKNMNLVFTARE
ncbi:hypothetical protein CKM354_001100500 [Cercospora kikuchii]|uniref:Pisatin demethylase n=1 Tax=Cercospora kikuchii TaxID=84275 RepID=A0A9P3CS48_9PEZI|nr:uncharacterized protein CKM354_001100500 [Cercospora kikuchii]GIZ47929.1 hypothetical protein CKM354_001100500 [Cercospora kikuchii]